MARLVLEMGDGGTKSGSNWERLKILADHFLRITGQVSSPDNGSASIARVGSTGIASGWKM
jgi:hypothetical protein